MTETLSSEEIERDLRLHNASDESLARSIADAEAWIKAARAEQAHRAEGAIVATGTDQWGLRYTLHSREPLRMTVQYPMGRDASGAVQYGASLEFDAMPEIKRDPSSTRSRLWLSMIGPTRTASED